MTAAASDDTAVKRKVLFVIPNLDAGGAEKAAVLISNALSTQYQYSITFFTFHAGQHFLPMVSPGVTVVQNEIYDDRSRIRRIFSAYVRIPFVLTGFIRRNRFDAVVSGFEFGPELPVMITSLCLRLIGQRKGIQFVSIIQNSISQLISMGSRNRMIMGMINAARPWTFDSVAAVSQAAIEGLDTHLRSHIRVIHNPVDIKDIQKKADMPTVSVNTASRRYFINVARIAQQKNQMMLLKAFRSIKDTIPEHLIIIGKTTEPEYYSRLADYIREQELTDRVEILDAVQNQHPLVKNAAAFIFPSLFEGLPLSVLEAMALKKIIIAARFHGCEELLSDENAFLVSTEEEMAKRMVEVSRGSLRMDQLSAQAFSDVMKFDISAVVQLYHELFSGRSEVGG